MCRNKSIELELGALQLDFYLPGGGKMKLARLVRRHLSWFAAAEHRGMSWSDMAQALAGAQITAKGDKQFAVGTLSSTVWRERAKSSAKRDFDGPGAGPSRRSPKAHTAKTPPTEAKLTRSAQPRKTAKTASIAKSSMPIASNKIVAPSHAQDSSSAKKEILTFMSRTRAVRRVVD